MKKLFWISLLLIFSSVALAADSDSTDINVIYSVDKFKGPASSSGVTTTINTGTPVEVNSDLQEQVEESPPDDHVAPENTPPYAPQPVTP